MTENDDYLEVDTFQEIAYKIMAVIIFIVILVLIISWNLNQHKPVNRHLGMSDTLNFVNCDSKMIRIVSDTDTVYELLIDNH